MRTGSLFHTLLNYLKTWASWDRLQQVLDQDKIRSILLKYSVNIPLEFEAIESMVGNRHVYSNDVASLIRPAFSPLGGGE